MNYQSGLKVKIPAEFLGRDEETDLIEVTIVKQAAPKIENDVNLHEACYVVRTDDGQEGVVCCDFFL